ncbi:hypothetical protein HanRHA438_Chr03g0121481 [Helianthus annuus]|nr:hypothetical protein HanIR_Chr03g0120871 [Helianthus annuus]KAJ0935604.1 hypothetical protein HanRHA438_Chr03g0121481 [Helianthus annuus]
MHTCIDGSSFLQTRHKCDSPHHHTHPPQASRFLCGHPTAFHALQYKPRVLSLPLLQLRHS